MLDIQFPHIVVPFIVRWHFVGSCLAHFAYSCLLCIIKSDIKLHIAFMYVTWKQKNWYLCYQLDEHKFFIDLTARCAFFFYFSWSPSVIWFGWCECREICVKKTHTISLTLCVYILCIHQSFGPTGAKANINHSHAANLSPSILFLHRIYCYNRVHQKLKLFNNSAHIGNAIQIILY